MMETTTGDLIRQAEALAVEELPQYVNTLEGYGDMRRQLLGIQEEAKELKKQCAAVVDELDAGQELANRLRTVEIQALRLTHVALGMCAKLRRFQSAALPIGGVAIRRPVDNAGG